MDEYFENHSETEGEDDHLVEISKDLIFDKPSYILYKDDWIEIDALKYNDFSDQEYFYPINN